MLIKSGTLGTVVGSGSIEYLAPYARRQYYEHKTKARWFETMKASHKDAIREGAESLLDFETAEANALDSKYNKYMLNQNTTQQFPHPQPQPNGNRQVKRKN